MKRGIIRIVAGILLITLQVLSIIGNGGNCLILPPPVSLGQLLFDIIFFASYYFVGIFGLLLLISGMCAYFDIHLSSKKSKQTAEEKHRFCKFCGGQIEPISKKCNGCGRQYFRLHILKANYLIPKVVVALSLIIVAICVFQINQYQSQIEQHQACIDQLNANIIELEEQIDSCNITIKQLESKVSTRDVRINNLLGEMNSLEKDIDFITKDVVFAENDTHMYHQFDCFVFKTYYRNDKNTLLPIYTAKEARQKGYAPCWLCID